jgi:hypothetical protein
VVSWILVNTIQSLNLKYPEISAAQRTALQAAGKALEAEAPTKK